MDFKEFLIDLIFPVYNRNEIREYFPNGGVGVKAAGTLSCKSCHFEMPIIWKSRSLKLLEPKGPVHYSNGIALPLSSWVVS